MIDIMIMIKLRHPFNLQLIWEKLIKSHAYWIQVYYDSIIGSRPIALISYHLLIHNSLIKCKFQPYED